jgi:hypothetical protein
MDKKEESEKEGCCSGHGRCCGGKMIGALILLLLGGVIGYLVGGHCSGYKAGCPYTSMMSAPATPPEK